MKIFGHFGAATLEGTRPGWRLKKPASEPVGPFSWRFVLGPRNLREFLASIRTCRTYRFSFDGKSLSLERAERGSRLIDIVRQGDRYMFWIRRTDIETQAALAKHLSELPGFSEQEQKSTAGTFVYFKFTGTGSAA